MLETPVSVNYLHNTSILIYIYTTHAVTVSFVLCFNADISSRCAQLSLCNAIMQFIKGPAHQQPHIADTQCCTTTIITTAKKSTNSFWFNNFFCLLLTYKDEY